MRYLLLFMTLLTFESYGQDCHIHAEIDCDTSVFKYASYKDSLLFYENYFGKDKEASVDDPKLKLAFFVALRHYPELKNVDLKIRLKKINVTMQAQPEWTFLFKSKVKRDYQILVNRDNTINGMFYKDLSFNSLVGWIGHELAHILDYSKKDNGQMISFIANYITSQERMRKTETKADKETIRHGLGIQLLDGVTFFHNSKRISREYRERKKKYYLSPDEIVAEIVENCD
jgi:hypothetical protein